jgi:alkanesulfonate monooxygenase SsuD/methylene tetrahydromethanopterin reductase-like flavin-dependent oxidoreductase (luciferase family)
VRGRLTVGLMAPTLFASEPCDLERLREAARIADESQVECLWVGDHLLWHVPLLDPIIALGVLAAETRTVKIGTAVLQLPLRTPVLVAQAFATLSHLTSGRVILGVGTGGEYGPESEAAGVDPSERGRRTDEGLTMLRRLWAGEREEGRFSTAPGVPVAPGPPSRIPIWVGGRSDPALRRAAREDGYIGYMLSPRRFSEVRERLAELGACGDDFTLGMQFMTRIGPSREEAADAATAALGRTYSQDPADFETYVAAGTPDQVAEFVNEYVERGLDHASFYLHGPGWPEQARRLTEDVLPLLDV